MPDSSSITERCFAIARLMRLSAAPTAISNVLAGAAVATGTIAPTWELLLLVGASLACYHGGMVLNDLRDVEQDRRERPTRPIPSGGVTEASAARLVYLLMLLGVGQAAIASLLVGRPEPLAVTLALVVAIQLYNSRLKRSWCGPWLMGGCRALNLLLGMSLAPQTAVGWYYAIGMLLFIAGLTRFAAYEADEAVAAKCKHLVGSVLISLGGIAWIGFLPWNRLVDLQVPLPQFSWGLLWSVLAMMVGRHYVAALISPKPVAIQRAVVGALQAILWIDAGLVLAYAGPYYGTMVLLLWPLSRLAALWLPMT